MNFMLNLFDLDNQEYFFMTLLKMVIFPLMTLQMLCF